MVTVITEMFVWYKLRVLWWTKEKNKNLILRYEFSAKNNLSKTLGFGQ